MMIVVEENVRGQKLQKASADAKTGLLLCELQLLQPDVKLTSNHVDCLYAEQDFKETSCKDCSYRLAATWNTRLMFSLYSEAVGSSSTVPSFCVSHGLFPICPPQKVAFNDSDKP
jgi:hypothetical protein